MSKKNRTSYFNKAKSDTVSLGSFGLRYQNGKIVEDTITLLKGPNKIKMLEEMVRFDPTIGGVDKMISSLFANLKFSVQEANDSKKAKKYAEFINSCLFEDLYGGFDQVVSDALTMRTYGFSILEKTFKKRKGYNLDPEKSSIYNDGLYGIASLSPRYQASIDEWIFDEDKKYIEYIKQKDPNTFTPIDIPYSKTLHFKYNSFNRNPQGQSLYQNCVVPYFKKKLASKIEDIRHEKGFDGIFEMSVPANLLASSTDPNIIAFQKYAKDTVENANSGKGVGHVKPHFVETKILNSNGSNTPDPDKIIARSDKDIAVALLSDMFLITQKSGSAGSFGQSKIKIFTKFTKSLLKEFTNVINNNLIPNLFELNNFDKALMPKLKHSEINDLDLTSLMLFVQSADKSGLVMPTTELSQAIQNQLLGDDAPIINKEDFIKYQNRKEVFTTDTLDKPNNSSLNDIDESGTLGK